jgi:hypothetical protein
MQRGLHTIRSGWTSTVNPTAPRRYSLDNGDFEVNMKITSFEIFPIGNDQTGGNNDKFGTDTVFFVLATSAAGATPTATTVSPDEYGATFNLRPSDSSQIGWGIMSPDDGYVETFLDPQHIIPEDLYICAWSLTTAGSITAVFHNVGFIINMMQVKSSGSEALLYQIKEAAAE